MAEKKESDIKILTTERPSGPENKSTLRTPSGYVEVVTMSIYAQVGVRVLRTYLQGLVGFLTAGVAGGATALNLPVGDFGALFMTAASLSIAPAAMSLLHNLSELLGKYDVSSPQMRA